MCGRFAVIKKLEEIAAYYKAQLSDGGEWRESYNVAPTQRVPVLVETDKGRTLRLMKWGLLPHWCKDPKKAAFNARGETIAENRFFSDSFKKRRCIIPATGFYEWKVIDKKRYPTYFTPKEGLFSFCGIWSDWNTPEGEKLETFSLITTTPNSVVEKIHDRMPVAITSNMIGAWLGANTPGDELKSFLAPYPASQMKGVEVSQYVNKFANHGEQCIQPLGKN